MLGYLEKEMEVGLVMINRHCVKLSKNKYNYSKICKTTA